MQVIATELDDCYIIEPDVYGDNRGYFMESHNEKKLQEHGLNYHFVQGNESGKIYDVAVDLRKDSKTYKKWIKVELSGENKRQLLLPRGFAHGFITLTDDVTFCYMVDNYYSKEHDAGIIYNDPSIGVDWGLESTEEPILSEKDKHLPTLEEIKLDF